MPEATLEQLKQQVAELKGYRALFDILDEGVCLFERLPLRPDGLRDYRYIAMNPAMQAMFGIPDLSGQSIRDNFPDEVEDWYDDYDRVLDSGASIRLVRGRLLRAWCLRCSWRVSRTVRESICWP
ncbi:MAG TPA: PAS domain-containing protein [Aquabacterium sp.]|nr:PAS domain-containing protein [Aquabacterium sp.]